MGEWARVKWTEAGQIADRLAWDEDLGEDAATSPERYFAKLRQGGRLTQAAFFLGQALPRFDTVAWAAWTVRDLRERVDPGPDADALKATLLWLQDPSDARRRSAFAAAGRVRNPTAERMVALAAFFSGGSITPEDCPAVQAPPEAAGRIAAGAVLVATRASASPDKALAKALDTGAALAEQRQVAGAS